ncbi:hypothetical protein A2866_06645 [Candidatus Roizmanbacteria bacterium RIFCSPHIGHO2_01_FULL_39_8]|uniref:Membrane protein 6-pyruvoyl-tetrahydropterin synthase-related domain-containing protein n=1 Tax=Candidatus Roizmanbacteria bacterium RIFCSPHIGHO2_01_FULL_39_8 TaxID=1802033 RepID=A0A1F7GJU7_9BACT|nr:MAG: hypothetical protein A2866_06645 [Candidatus Roizmanbacteria bacterium RIFCSPHIGHO2_01_FULL_39_8]
MVDEAVKVGKQVFAGRLSPLYLLDSWQERWAEGFALSSYYSHLPQAVIGLISIGSNLNPYELFVWIRTLLLIFLPIMFFWGATVLGLSGLTSLLVALFSQAIFTNGLYGIDVSSFLWRGWGLSSQLMALFFMPPAFAYAMKYLQEKKALSRAVLFNFILAQSHFGMFSLLLLGYGLYLPYRLSVMILQELSLDYLKGQRSKIKAIAQILNPQKIIYEIIIPWVKFIFLTLFSLSYFIVPFFLQSDFRNYSIWDPIWKFDSWGLKQAIVWFLNGDLFDYGRFPVISIVVILGVLWGIGKIGEKGKETIDKRYEIRDSLITSTSSVQAGFMSFLFGFYFLLFSGKTTLGNLINLIPGMAEYHQHRTIVMVQFIGIYLGAWFVYSLLKKLDTVFFRRVGVFKKGIFISILIIASLFIIYYLEQPLVSYAKDNALWIARSNKAYLYDLPAYKKIKDKLESMAKGRLYVGKPGNWGRQFTVGETPLYMQISQDGFPVINFLPESWSPNSDTEQFFDENNQDFYNLYNVRYSILPDNIKPPEFAKLVEKQGKYNLFQIDTTGWFDSGNINVLVRSKKTNLLNITRLWFGNKLLKEKNYPVIDLRSDQSNKPTHEWIDKLWQIQMVDKNNFINLNDQKERSIWIANPMETSFMNLVKPSQEGMFEFKNEKASPNGYTIELRVKKDCQNCIVILKESFHPNWQIKLNSQSVMTFPVFPFYIGFTLHKQGEYSIEAIYQQNTLKKFLLLLEAIFIFYLVYILLRKVKTRLRS